LFQTYSRTPGRLTGNPLPQANAYAMIQRRARAAEITTKIGQSQVPNDGRHRVPKERRDAPARRADSEPSQHKDDAAL